MRYVVAIFVLTWGLWRMLWMGQRQPGDGRLTTEPQSGPRNPYPALEILQELQSLGIHLPTGLENKIKTAVGQQRLQQFVPANQSYAGLEKAQMKPNEPAINLFERSKKLAHNFALLQDALKAQGK